MMESMRNLQLVLFIWVMRVVQTMALICAYNDPKCTCGDNYITCSSLPQLPQLNTGANVNQVTSFIVNSGYLTTIATNSLPPGLTEIYLNSHPLTNISDDAFDTSAGTLQLLHITNAEFTKLPLSLKSLTALTDLTITGAKIQNWDLDILKHIAATVEILELSDVGLSSWPSWLSDFLLLRKLDLSRNYLYSVPDDAFSGVKDTLTDLALSFTGLTRVPKALSTLSNLTDLDLSSNTFKDASEIEKINGLPFSQKLSRLNLDSVGMTRMVNFSNLTSLEYINLSFNILSDIPAGLLPISLTSLIINSNNLSSVPTVTANLSRLSDLLLTNNVITDIEPSSFPSSVTYLDLSSNNIDSVINNTIRNLNLLRTLRVSDNPISKISPEAFSDLISLQYLYIQRSQLIEIPLAFALLNSQTQVYFSTTQPLACPCPVFHKLVQWFTSLENSQNIEGNCSSGQSIDSYLSGQCDPSLAAP